MPGTFFGLSIGTSGLYASQAGLNTTAHNISNTDTEGYTRQVAKQKASSALRVNNSYGMVGSGVDITGVEQIRDSYYDEKYRVNNTTYGNYNTKNYYMTSIENYFNEVKLNGFTGNFDSMYNSIQELSKNPTDLTVRTQVSNMAQNVTEFINSLANSLESIQEECNFEIRNQVNRINSLAQQISTITKQINTLEVGGGTANDLRDQRNLMVEELSGFGNISVTENKVGQGVGPASYIVKMDSQTLVDTYQFHQLQVIPRESKIDNNDAEGLYDIYWDNGQKLNAHSPTLGGTIQALFQVRDGNNGVNFNGKAAGQAGDLTVTLTQTSVNQEEMLNIPATGTITIGNYEYEYSGFAVSQEEETGKYVYEFALTDGLVADYDAEDAKIGNGISYKGIPYYMSELNKFARTFAKAFNKIQTSGVDLNGEQGQDYFNGKDLVTGENFILKQSEEDRDAGYLFTSRTGDYAPVNPESKNYGSYYLVNAKNFCVSKEVYENPSKLATSTTNADGIANNDNVKKFIALKDDVSMFSQGKPAQFFQTLVAEIGIDTKKSQNFSDNQSDILKSINNQRLSISGVDEEDEAMSLMRYQNAYGLSAKVITVMNECFDKLINYMGA